ncbi:MAG: type II toxin-antitoxin system VapC family toxin [Micrococcales bacterium]|nr:type II toxin-antitoxin system VapC family toxin [Micrococcales bacterium]
MPLFYLDASIGIQALLETPHRQRLITWIDHSDNEFVSSRLLRTEIVRVLRREGEPVSTGEVLLARVGLFDITEKIHQQAEAISSHIRTLDALHLATALLIPEVVTVATHDSLMAKTAGLMGLPAVDPISELGA